MLLSVEAIYYFKRHCSYDIDRLLWKKGSPDSRYLFLSYFSRCLSLSPALAHCHSLLFELIELDKLCLFYFCLRHTSPQRASLSLSLSLSDNNTFALIRRARDVRFIDSLWFFFFFANMEQLNRIKKRIARYRLPSSTRNWRKADCRTQRIYERWRDTVLDVVFVWSIRFALLYPSIRSGDSSYVVRTRSFLDVIKESPRWGKDWTRFSLREPIDGRKIVNRDESNGFNATNDWFKGEEEVREKKIRFNWSKDLEGWISREGQWRSSRPPFHREGLDIPISLLSTVQL